MSKPSGDLPLIKGIIMLSYSNIEIFSIFKNLVSTKNFYNIIDKMFELLNIATSAFC